MRSRFIGDPSGQLNCLAKSMELDNVPMTRNLPGLCIAVFSLLRTASGRIAPHHTCPKLRKNNCSPVILIPGKLVFQNVSLTLSTFTIQSNANFSHSIISILRYNTSGSLIETFNSRIGPPFMYAAITIEQTTLIIETMRQLMTNYHTNTTEI
ncbi:hypothetical protein FF38_05204 [Lucilia cuprina]|uniref:Uncharacterized protein n=1 Tax=Lucilia cuprina TaxID=7375 RepID=A0A0L0BWV3_LUCCU|nr:hypothetical protein FF38_05204 [Lucilia cuprina]